LAVLIVPAAGATEGRIEEVPDRGRIAGVAVIFKVDGRML